MQDISNFKVNQHHCKTCPFKPDEHGCWQNPDLAGRVLERTLFQAQQICHGTNNTTLCRGARDYYLEIYARLGMISAPTDEAWEEAKTIHNS